MPQHRVTRAKSLRRNGYGISFIFGNTGAQCVSWMAERLENP
jgi:hypothetical protein